MIGYLAKRLVRWAFREELKKIQADFYRVQRNLEYINTTFDARVTDHLLRCAGKEVGWVRAAALQILDMEKLEASKQPDKEFFRDPAPGRTKMIETQLGEPK